MLVYDGRVDKAVAERVWNDFAYPPVVIDVNNQQIKSQTKN